MILEIALIPIADGKGDQFEDAVRTALRDLFPKASGFRRGDLRRGVERPGTFALLLEWETVEDHTDGFVKSDLFDRWLELTDGLIVEEPVVEHWRQVSA